MNFEKLKSLRVEGIVKSRPQSGLSYMQGTQREIVKSWQDLLDEKIGVIQNHKEKSDYHVDYGLKLKLLPPYLLYQSFYDSFYTVRAIVDDIASMTASLGNAFKDKLNGYENGLVKEEFERRYGSLDTYVQEVTIALLTQGQAIDSKYNYGEGDRRGKDFGFRLIPSYETSLYHIKEYAHPHEQIQSFTWSNNDIADRQEIKLYDKDNGRNFFIARQPSSSLYVSSPRLEAAAVLIDSVNRDDKDYQTRLKNFGFSPIVAFTSDQSMQADVESVIRSLRDYDMRDRIPIISNAISENGSPNVVFKEFNTEIRNRLDTAGRREVDRQLCSLFGYPPVLLAVGQGSLSSGKELEASLEKLKTSVIIPNTKIIEFLANSFRIKDGLKQMELDGWFRQMFESDKIAYKEEGKEPRMCTAEDFRWEINRMDVLTTDTKWNLAASFYNSGFFSSAEAKIFAGWNAKDVADDDKHKKLRSGDVIVKEGKLKEGVIGKDKVEGILDETNEEIAEEQTESTEVSEQSKDEDKSQVNYINKALDIRSIVLDRGHPDVFKNVKYKKFAREAENLHKQDVLEYNKAQGTNESLDNFSRLPALLVTKKVKILKAELNKILEAQYFDLIDGYFGNQKYEKAEAEEILEDLKKRDFNLNLNPTSLVGNMQYFARRAFEIYLEQAEAEGVVVSDDERVQIRQQINEWIENRVKNLMYGSGGNETDETDLLNPYYDGNLSRTTWQEVALIIALILASYPNASKEEQVALARAEARKRLGTRVALIVDDNLSRAFGVAGLIFAKVMGAKTKTWLRTTSMKPRTYHLTTVGQTIPFEEYFMHSNGSREYWANTSPNCRCSIKVNYK